MKNETSDRATWKQMFLFTKDGKLQSMDLMYSFFLGIAELFLYFLIANRLTILIEDVFPAMARSGKNWLGILIPAVLCALIAGLIFRIIRKKKIVLMSCWFGVMLIAVILVILLFELDHETLEALIPAYIGIFMIPAAAGAAAVTLLFRNWLKSNPDPLREEEKEAAQEQEDPEDRENEEPDYSGWKQFR